MHSLNGHLIRQLQPVFESLPDPRRGKNIQYQYADIAMAAFSIFHMLSPSFLHYQRIMDARLARNNCCSLYRMQRIPSDNHIRAQLDAVEPAALNAAFEIAPRLLLQHPNVHRNFQILDDRTLIAVDGTQFHSSYKIHCNQCSKRKHKTTGTEYHHNAAVAVLAAPKHKQILPLAVEFVTPQDGDKKQDCETKAVKRLLRQHAGAFDQRFKPVYLGDDLYACQPISQQILEQPNSDFIFNCKPGSHQLIQQYLHGIELPQLKRRRKNKRNQFETFHFKWLCEVPIRDSKDALKVNWLSVQVSRRGKVVYRNDFITSLPVNANTVETIVQAARSRWRIENESFNTLKRKGYNLSHNFGHGKRGLTNTLFQLNLLAFAFHTISDFLCAPWQQARKYWVARYQFFENLRAISRLCYFDDWSTLLKTLYQTRAPPR